MDAFQETTPRDSPPARSESPRSGERSVPGIRDQESGVRYQKTAIAAAGPTDACLLTPVSSLHSSPSETGRWQAEAARFLDDIERRFDDILSQLGAAQGTGRNRPSPPALPERAPDYHPAPIETTTSDSDRISALKAQLARKLHNFEETTDDTSDRI